MTNAEIYAPYLAAFERVAKKRHIHKCKLETGSNDAKYGVFLQTKVTPHRSKGGVHLVFIFTTSHIANVAKPMVRVKVSTWSQDEPNAGAIGDALMLIAELTEAWTAIAEGVGL